jgi:hypothetical protein
VGFVVDKEELRQFFSEYFAFLPKFIVTITRGTYNRLEVADVTSGPN